MQWLISDANVLIDMEEGKLLTLFCDLPFTFCVAEILYFAPPSSAMRSCKTVPDGFVELPTKWFKAMQVTVTY